jgi:hypothetical protein
MSLTRVAPSLIAVANNVTSNVFGSANTIPSFTFDASGVISTASNTAIQINTADIVANAVTTAKIAAGAITNAKVALTGNLVISGATSGSTTIQATDGATQTITLPNATGTIALTAAPTFTGQATIPTINLTGGQITFPATQSASADANTLDDYEEGTWTPTITGVSTYTIQNAVYTKIGKFVTLYGEIAATDPGGLAAFDIASLPFAIQATVYPVGNLFPVLGWTTNATALILQGTPGATTARAYWLSNGATNFNNITSSDLAATFNVEFSLSYISTN